MRPRVTIGEFSRASHLSVKTLHHYHEARLLEPTEIDPRNGYRYDAGDQIPLAQVIRRLRALQMPVAEVKLVLAAPDPEARNRLIVAHLDRLEGDLARTRGAVPDYASCWSGRARRVPWSIGPCRQPQRSRSRRRSIERT